LSVPKNKLSSDFEKRGLGKSVVQRFITEENPPVPLQNQQPEKEAEMKKNTANLPEQESSSPPGISNVPDIPAAEIIEPADKTEPANVKTSAEKAANIKAEETAKPAITETVERTEQDRKAEDLRNTEILMAQIEKLESRLAMFESKVGSLNKLEKLDKLDLLDEIREKQIAETNEKSEIEKMIESRVGSLNKLEKLDKLDLLDEIREKQIAETNEKSQKETAAETPKHFLFNAMEEAVREEVALTMKNVNMCKCEKCFYDVCAIVLNNTKAEYATSREGVLIKKAVTLLNMETLTKLSGEIFKAIDIVKKNPAHN
jgi:competence protein ComFB